MFLITKREAEKVFNEFDQRLTSTIESVNQSIAELNQITTSLNNKINKTIANITDLVQIQEAMCTKRYDALNERINKLELKKAARSKKKDQHD